MTMGQTSCENKRSNRPAGDVSVYTVFSGRPDNRMNGGNNVFMLRERAISVPPNYCNMPL